MEYASSPLAKNPMIRLPLKSNCLQLNLFGPLVAIVCGLLISCTGPPAANDVSLIANPNPNAPLAGILTFTSDRPVVPSLLIEDGEHQQIVTPDEVPRTEHKTLVLGLRPGKVHSVTVTIRDQKGRETVLDALEIETPPLPDDFPPIEVLQSDPGTMEPGLTVFNLFRWTGPFEDDSNWGLLVAVDEKGDVLWYLQSDFGLGEARRMYNGNLTINGHEDGRNYELDMLGNMVTEWHTSGSITGALADNSIPVATDAFHHDVIQISSGNFIGLGLEVLDFENFPAEYPPGTKRAATRVAGDVLIEFAPDGATLREWSVSEILDPERLGSGSLNQSFYEKVYKNKYDTIPYDITHSNALYYIENEDALIVSSYQQCIIYKVDMSTGELIWILGDPVGWTAPWSDKLLKPKGDLTWPCHQHGIEMTPQGTILLYDNGSGRNIPPQEPMAAEDQYSRVVEYRVDEHAGTVEEVWTYGPAQEHFASPFICDADYLPETGNILITDGGRFKNENGEPMNTFGGHQWARVLEVTYTDKKKIWELVIHDPKTRYSMYRAQRFSSLYPKLDRKTG